jgi:hypothetical protein
MDHSDRMMALGHYIRVDLEVLNGGMGEGQVELTRIQVGENQLMSE